MFSIPFTVTTDPGRLVYYVDWRAKGTQDGMSWTNAFTDLQSALTAVEGKGRCEIRVSQGVRTDLMRGPMVPRAIPAATFQLMEDVTLKGGYAGLGSSNPNQRDMLVHESILSGDLEDNDDPSAIRHRLVE